MPPRDVTAELCFAVASAVAPPVDEGVVPPLLELDLLQPTTAIAPIPADSATEPPSIRRRVIRALCTLSQKF